MWILFSMKTAAESQSQFFHFSNVIDRNGDVRRGFCLFTMAAPAADPFARSRDIVNAKLARAHPVKVPASHNPINKFITSLCL